MCDQESNAISARFRCHGFAVTACKVLFYSGACICLTRLTDVNTTSVRRVPRSENIWIQVNPFVQSECTSLTRIVQKYKSTRSCNQLQTDHFENIVYTPQMIDTGTTFYFMHNNMRNKAIKKFLT